MNRFRERIRKVEDAFEWSDRLKVLSGKCAADKEGAVTVSEILDGFDFGAEVKKQK